MKWLTICAWQVSNAWCKFDVLNAKQIYYVNLEYLDMCFGCKISAFSATKFELSNRMSQTVTIFLYNCLLQKYSKVLKHCVLRKNQHANTEQTPGKLIKMYMCLTFIGLIFIWSLWIYYGGNVFWLCKTAV